MQLTFFTTPSIYYTTYNCKNVFVRVVLKSELVLSKFFEAMKFQIYPNPTYVEINRKSSFNTIRLFFYLFKKLFMI